jgi:hypothetical protein
VPCKNAPPQRAKRCGQKDNFLSYGAYQPESQNFFSAKREIILSFLAFALTAWFCRELKNILLQSRRFCK